MTDIPIGYAFHGEFGPVWDELLNEPIDDLEFDTPGFEVNFIRTFEDLTEETGTLTLADSGSFSLVNLGDGYYSVLVPEDDPVLANNAAGTISFHGSMTGAYDFPGKSYRLISQPEYDRIYDSAGFGARSVVINVTDLSSSPLQGALVRVTSNATAHTHARYTNSIGRAAFSLDDDTWVVSITLLNYSFEPVDLVVDGNESRIYQMTSDAGSSSSSDVGAGINLRLLREEDTHYRIGDVNGFRLRVTAVDAVGMTAKIFRYEYGIRGDDEEPTSHFDGTCSAPDLAEYPEDAPNSGDFPQFYRLDYFDLVLRSVVEVADVWNKVSSEVDVLIASLALADDLRTTDEHTWVNGVMET